jgi:hypothetical protein
MEGARSLRVVPERLTMAPDAACVSSAAPYEPPRLTRVGSLRDLLAGASGRTCDAIGGALGTGTFEPGEDCTG